MKKPRTPLGELRTADDAVGKVSGGRSLVRPTASGSSNEPDELGRSTDSRPGADDPPVVGHRFGVVDAPGLQAQQMLTLNERLARRMM